MGGSARDAAVAHVARRFPELGGVRPTASGPAERKTFTFAKNVEIAPGRTLRQVVRVTVDGNGRILKVAASR